MALYPLLANQCHKKIIICDGTEDTQETCQNLLLSLNLARAKLNCSFLSNSGDSDIENEIKRFSESKQQACFRFKVVYHSESGDIGKLASSEIIYLKPRSGFAETFEFEQNLHGCCCEFCHSPKMAFTAMCCGQFPQVTIWIISDCPSTSL